MKRVHYYCDHCGEDCGDAYFEIWRNKFNGLTYDPVGKSDYCVSCYEKLKVRPTGKWIFKHNSSDVWCSNCDISLESNMCEGIKFSYCPNCGADMRVKGGGQ